MRSFSTAESIGRQGELNVRFARRAHETVVTDAFACSPWHFLPPMPLEGGSTCLNLVNPSGGLVGGDVLRVRVTADAGAHVLCTTPSANRVYRSLSTPARQVSRIRIGRGGAVEWVPEVTIPFAGAKLEQGIHVTLEEGATLLLWDALASGRVARGERWSWASIENEIDIHAASQGRVRECFRLEPTDGRMGIGLAAGWDYVGTFYILSDAVSEETWKRLEEEIAEGLDNRQGRVLGGVSEPAVRGLIVKVLAKSAPDFANTFETVWAAARARLWGLPLPALRRY